MNHLMDMLFKALNTPLATICYAMYRQICASLVMVLQFSKDDLAQTPDKWNVGSYQLAQQFSHDYILPISVIVITFVMCYELVTMVINSNNFHDIDTSLFIRWIMKLGISLFVLDHAFEIISAIFVIVTDIITKALSGLQSDSAINVIKGFAISDPETIWNLASHSTGELIVYIMFLSIACIFMYIAIPVVSMVVICRMVSIYLYMTIAPIPMATFGNREWGQVGNHYVKTMLALAFQGFLIVALFGVFYGVVTSITISTQDIQNAVIQILVISFVLIKMLFSTESIAKSVFATN